MNLTSNEILKQIKSRLAERKASDENKNNKIDFGELKKGSFTEQAKRAGMGVQEFARHVLANKDDFTATTEKRANFARNAKKFND